MKKNLFISSKLNNKVLLNYSKSILHNDNKRILINKSNKLFTNKIKFNNFNLKNFCKKISLKEAKLTLLDNNKDKILGTSDVILDKEESRIIAHKVRFKSI